MGIGTSRQATTAQVRAVADFCLFGPLPIKGLRDLVLEYSGGFSGTKTTVLQHASFVRRVAFVDEQFVATSSDEGIQVWDLKTGLLAHELGKHASYVNNMVILGNGKLAAANVDGFVHVWDLALQACERVLAVPAFFAMVAFGQDHLIASSTEPWVQVVHTTTGRVEKTIPHPDWVRAIAVVDKKQIATGCDDEVVRLWDFETSACLREFSGHAGLVSALTVWDGKLVSGSADKTLRVWNIETGGQKILRGHTANICNVVAVGSDLVSVGDNDVVLVWSLECEQEVLVQWNGRVSSAASVKTKLAICIEKQVAIWE